MSEMDLTIGLLLTPELKKMKHFFQVWSEQSTFLRRSERGFNSTLIILQVTPIQNTNFPGSHWVAM